MAEAARAIQTELMDEALAAANSSNGLSKLIGLLLTAPRIADSPEGKQFMAALRTYVRLKRQRARWVGGDRVYYGTHKSSGYGSATVPTEGEVKGARMTKNYWLSLLCERFGDDEAMKLQKSFGLQVNGGLDYNSRGE